MMKFLKTRRKWIVLFVAFAFLYMLEVSTLPLHAGKSRGENETGVTKSSDAPNLMEKTGSGPTYAKKKHFPWLWVIAGGLLVAAGIIFLTSINKKYTLTVSKGDGVDGTPASGSFQYKKGETVSWNYTLNSGFTGPRNSLQVTLDGAAAAAAGTVTMNADHTLAARVQNSGLELEWLFDGNVQDTSGKGRHGTNIGATLCADHHGVSGKALYFNGTDAYVQGPDFIAHQNNCFTVSVWIKKTWPFDHPFGPILGGNGFGMGGETTKISFYVYLSDGSINRVMCGIPHDTWTHLAATYDGAFIRFYSNGTPGLTVSFAGSVRYQNQKFEVGGHPGGAIPFWEGYVDDLRIYSYCMSDSEIAQLAGL